MIFFIFAADVASTASRKTGPCISGRAIPPQCQLEDAACKANFSLPTNSPPAGEGR